MKPMSEAALAQLSVEKTESVAVPWYLWAGLIASTSAVVGGQWDISWHRSIGRDTFWTPAHMAIYLCGLLGGVSGGWVVLASTFGAGVRRAATVGIWGFRGPLGAFLCIWGGVAMLTSAPFDDWWHSAYGLDVKILSPPHVVLILGLTAIQMGALLEVLGEMNRAEGSRRRALEWMFLYGGAMMFIGLQTILMEYSFRSNLHRAQAYRVMAPVAVLLLVGLARASRRRWAATFIATQYTVFMMALILLLPLFPAEPKLGPVYQNVTHFIPPEFPLLYIVPAIALDVLLAAFAGRNKWITALFCGTAFFTILLTVQWPFANFLMSPASRNWFFGTHYLSYGAPPWSYTARHAFLPTEPGPQFLAGMLTGVVLTIGAARLGIARGDWMRQVQR